jgi:hypothetical protein
MKNINEFDITFEEVKKLSIQIEELLEGYTYDVVLLSLVSNLGRILAKMVRKEDLNLVIGRLSLTLKEISEKHNLPNEENK